MDWRIKIKRLCCVSLLFMGCWQVGFGKEAEVKLLKELNVMLYTLSTREDTISFIKADTNTICRKPTLVFCQGSLPIPLVIADKQYGCYFSVFNFDYRKLAGDYNLIVISMPHTPPVAETDHLDARAAYIPDLSHPGSLSVAYLTDNYLEKYVERANEVIGYVLSQSWADPQEVYVMGHSQGAAVAVGIACTNKKVKAVGYLGGDPDGRFTQKIKDVRRLVQQKRLSPEEGQRELDAWWKEICADTSSYVSSGDSPHTWRSFSRPLREELVKLEVPVFVAYGTEDIAASSCELMPVYFELNRKTDYRMYPVVGCGHNFEEFTAEGKPDYDRMHWQEVVDCFVDYIKEL